MAKVILTVSAIQPISNGWRRGRQPGFSVDPQTGRWERREQDRPVNDDDASDDPLPISGVELFVSDSRNLFLIRILTHGNNREFLTTLLYAIKRSVQFQYQVEEQEVEAERFQTEIIQERALQAVEEAKGIAEAQKIISEGLTPAYLTFHYIEKLAELPPGSVVYVPTEGGVPLMRMIGGGGN